VTVDEGADLVKKAITLEGITEPESAKKAPDNRSLGLIIGQGSDVKGLVGQLLAAFESGRFYDRPNIEEMAV